MMRETILVDRIRTIEYRNDAISMKDASENPADLFPKIKWDHESINDALETKQFRSQIYWSIHSDNATMFFSRNRMEKAKALQAKIDMHLAWLQ